MASHADGGPGVAKSPIEVKPAAKGMIAAYLAPAATAAVLVPPVALNCPADMQAISASIAVLQAGFNALIEEVRAGNEATAQQVRKLSGAMAA